jgi:N-acetylmuramoyl-L-alanine amidase
MLKNSPPLHKPKQLPSKNIFLIILFLFLSITVATTVVLANENRVTVQASVLNVRIGPGLSHDVMTQVQQDDQLNVLGEENQWYKVRLSNDQIGWVASWLVENEEITAQNQQFGRVTGSSVNIRQFATTDSEVIGTVYEGTELQILYQDGEWFQVLYMGRVAWIHTSYLEQIDSTSGELVSAESQSTQEVIVGESRVNIRTSPSTDADVLAMADPGDRFIYLNTDGDWYEVQIDNDTTGYIASWVVQLETVSTISNEAAEAQVSRAATDISEATIVIDAGHGGRDPGAIATNDAFTEKEIALRTSLLLERRLRDAGANVVLTRSDDTFISLNDRAVISESANADAFISVHYDAMDTPNSMTGTTTYYFSENERQLAETVNAYLDSHGPLRNNGVRTGDYFVLRNNRQPSILLELGYLNHDYDITVVNTDSYQSTIVEAIYQGLREYFAQ